MPRIRSLKPEFWADEKLSLLDPTTRLVFLGLVSLADDAGRLVDNVKQLDGMFFPNTDDTCAESLEILARLSRILRYVAPSGQHLIQVVNWHHQKVDHPSAYVLPAPTEDDYAQAVGTEGDTASLAQVSRGVREARANVSRDARASISTSTSTSTNTSASTPLARREMTSEERMVFDHFLKLHPKRRMSEDKARRLIAARLKTFTPQELCTALDANLADPWHAERKKHELSYVLRDDEKVSGWLDRAAPSSPSSSAGPLSESWLVKNGYGPASAGAVQ